jgi:hypothetical protein
MSNILVTQADEPGYSGALVASIGRADAPLAAAFVAGLTDDIRHRRFHRDLSPSMIQAQYDALDWDTATVLTWSEGDDILGVAEIYPYRATGGLETEIVLTLNPDGNHIGSPLMAFALSRAAAGGAQRSLMLVCRPDPVLFGIARHLGARLDTAQDIFVFTH